MQRPRLVLLLLVLVLGLATTACGGFSFAGQGGGSAVSPPDPNQGAGGGAVGGGAPGGGAVGGGVIGPDQTMGPGGVDPGTGMRPSIETPVPGQLQPSAVSVWAMKPTIDGRHVTVLLEWWSGPAPCSVLDSVVVAKADRTITMTPMEGADPSSGGQVACPAIAMLRGTIVDLGNLDPGSYTLLTHGDLAPIEITIK
jgi:hypothetical protein